MTKPNEYVASIIFSEEVEITISLSETNRADACNQVEHLIGKLTFDREFASKAVLAENGEVIGGYDRNASEWTLRKRYEGLKVNDPVRAYDFEPMPGRPDKYVEGTIIHVLPHGTTDMPFAHYVVRVYVDTVFPDAPRDTVFVPMEMGLDYDGRVVAIAKQA